MRNILDACPKALQGELHGRLRLIFDSPDMEAARRLLNETIEAFSGRAHKAVERLEVRDPPAGAGDPDLPQRGVGHPLDRCGTRGN